MKKIHTIILLILFCLLLTKVGYSQQTLYSFSSTANTWSLTDGGANCSCTPTANDTVVVSHNWANPAFYPLTHPANLAFGSYLSVNPIKVVVRSGGVVYQQGTIPTGMILEVQSGGMWAFNGSLQLHGTNPNSMLSLTNDGSVLVNGSYDNRISINSTGEFCKNGSYLNDITVPASLNGITDANMDPYFNYQNYGAWCYQGMPLPIELIYFDYIIKDDYITFNWYTATEINNDYFELLVSKDVQEWSTLAQIDSKNSNSMTLQTYSYTTLYDSNSNSNSNDNDSYNYVKLRQTDFDGTQSDSPIIYVNNKEKSFDDVYVEVNKNNLLIHNDYMDSIPVKIFDLSGRLLFYNVIDKGITRLDISEVTNSKGLIIISVGSINKKTIID
jgi:hypothetical protein